MQTHSGIPRTPPQQPKTPRAFAKVAVLMVLAAAKLDRAAAMHAHANAA